MHACVSPSLNPTQALKSEPARAMGFTLHLTRRWQPHYGGHLYFMRGGEDVPPSFNSLTIFPTHHDSVHQVTPVAPHASLQPDERRLAFQGKWIASADSGGGGEHSGGATRLGPLQSFPPLPASLRSHLAVFQGMGGARMPHGDVSDMASFG